jgi:polyisoprenoid-binding protein YceI
MYKQLFRMAFASLLYFGLGTAVKADDFTIDAVHSGVSFQISHLGLSRVHGRFNNFGGSFTIDTSDPSKSAFSLSIKADSVDTNNTGRDGHLKSPDFFNVKQFPTINFKSTSVKPIDGGYEVTGDLTLHGVTNPVTFSLKGGKSAEFPSKVIRTGFSTSEFVVKRSDFGVGKPMPVLGDEVYVTIGFEGTKK